MLKERIPERISRRTFLALVGAATVGKTAYEIGKRLPFLSSTASPEFSPKEIEQLKDFDVVLVFNPGGLGHTSLEEDPGWKEILEKTQEELENRGYKTAILEELRQKSPLSSLSPENTVMRIKQLTELFPNLKIVLTGRSTGASFIENVLRALPENNQVLAIEAIRPFGDRNPLVAPKRTLMVEYPQTDPLEEGNIREIFKGILSSDVFIGKGGDWGIGRLRVDLRWPEHDSCCSWNPQIENVVKEFLDIYFPSKK
jgi:hypothetical protein